MSTYELDTASTPPSWPSALGALGSYDDAVLKRMLASRPDSAAALSETHRDRNCVLYLDRAPVEWRGGDRRGLAWSEGLRARDAISGWEHASARLGACGLQIPDAPAAAPVVHSSVAGALPLYYRELGDAVYFSSRIDALANAGGALSVDWEAWAGILTIGCPIGDRTPFAEIRRLRPHNAVSATESGATVYRPAWPWAEVEPSETIASGASAVHEAMRGAVAPMREREIVSALSGGWDSRLILSVLMEEPVAAIRAMTVNSDTGRDLEERLARQVAEACGIEHETVVGDPAAYWDELTERYRRSEYQRPSNAWLVTLARRIERENGPIVTDGLGLETLMGGGDKFVSEDVTLGGRGPDIAEAMWESLTQDRLFRAFEPKARRAVRVSARRQFLEEVEWLHGHPSQAILTRYVTRTLRGTTLAVGTALGCSVRALPPFIADDVAQAVLRVRPKETFGGRLYKALFEASNPRVGALPSTHDTDPGERTGAIRRASAEAVSNYAGLLGRSPLSPVLAPPISEAIAAGDVSELVAGMKSHWRVAAISMFGMWSERYSEQLGAIDTGELRQL